MITFWIVMMRNYKKKMMYTSDMARSLQNLCKYLALSDIIWLSALFWKACLFKSGQRAAGLLLEFKCSFSL